MVQIGHLSDRDGERMTETEDIIDWLQHHTLEDMRDIARELASKGEDVTEIVDVIKQLEDISAMEGVGVAQTA
jgi:uncharacterized protein YfkK (UPF0435 family)